MMRQYMALKREQPDAILLFRCGDFYETYADDAEEAGRLLNIIVTRKAAGGDGDVAMAGVPHHALDNYLAKLVRLGKRVAIAEQTEDPKQAKGLVQRAIVRVVTPGTAVDDALLEDRSNNYLVALCEGKNGDWGVAVTDVSTGFFALTEVDAADSQAKLVTELARLDAREILLPEDLEASALRPLLAERDIPITRRRQEDFRHANARRLLLDHFNVQSLEGFGAEELETGVCAAGALLRYIRETQKTAIGHIANLRVHYGKRAMVLDAVTQRSLELVRNLHGDGREGTLLSILDRTVTPMGARMLKRWMLEPLCERAAIEARLDAVDNLVASLDLRENAGELLRGVKDLERIVSRMSMGVANPREMAALRLGLDRLPELRRTLTGANAPLLKRLGEELNLLEDLRREVATALVEEPPANLQNGGAIRDGYSDELDELKAVARDSKTWIAQFRAREAERTGVDKLKIGYNRVFGYYIEITHAQMRQIPGGEPPEDYIRKQTLTNSERFITPELKEKEDIILHAEERLVALEQQLFDALRRRVADHAVEILHDAEVIANVDCLRSFAVAAMSGRYVRPRINEDDRLEIVDGRHPVLEAIQTDPPFVPNDALMSPDDCQIALITGPNMAGKSTYIRQVALIVLMAHMGCFVPAGEADISLVDRIFTRVGAMDHLARGQSTFLVEMTETANILRHATTSSLVILDEIGRGTSTYDGLSIAWSVVEYLHNTPGRTPKTLFATHYHELTSLEGPLPRLRNHHVAILEEKTRVVFLFKVIPGATDRSYGVHAAEYAGVPADVVTRAREILGGLERGEAVAPRVASGEKIVEGKKVRGKKAAAILPQADPWEDQQLSLFDSAPPHEAVERLKKLDPNRLTPMEALAVLAELKRLTDDSS